MALLWTEFAKDDLQRLYNFIADYNLEAAEAAIELIFTEGNRLLEFPEIGKMMDDNETFREWIFQFGSRGYALQYEVRGNRVILLRIWHGREDR